MFSWLCHPAFFSVYILFFSFLMLFFYFFCFLPLLSLFGAKIVLLREAIYSSINMFSKKHEFITFDANTYSSLRFYLHGFCFVMNGLWLINLSRNIAFFSMIFYCVKHHFRYCIFTHFNYGLFLMGVKGCS